MEALESDAYTQAVEAFGRDFPRPAAIVVASAHWASPGPFAVTAASRPETIHDFHGFPDELHAIRYDAPGDPDLAGRIVRRLTDAGLPAELDTRRGLDHGAWVPLLRLRPAADVPVLELRLPVPSRPDLLLQAGRALAPLRDEGVLLMGSGNVTHNLRRAVFGDKGAAEQPWATAFDAWVWERVQRGDADALRRYLSDAPNAALAAPDADHFDPIFFVVGAADGDRPAPLYEGFHFGNLSMRSWWSGTPRRNGPSRT
jgi:4,5-DOPA dioxygenase extradiol